MRDPGAAADVGRGRQVDAFTESVDLMPTVLDWLERDTPAQCDGRSLLPFLRGATPLRWRTEAHMELDFRSGPYSGLDAEAALELTPDECQLAIIRGDRWKYVFFAALSPLLFDLHADPGEMHDLSGDPAYREVLIEMAHKMLSWRLIHQEHVLTNLHNGPNGVEDRRPRIA